ncbi:sortase [Chloroflexales bacterium ZM16-3]|nr:sortase [Chloroflexales bacterium ZM16-3]
MANTAAGTPVLLRETGHTLAYSFREFYDRQGGLPIIGLPITEVFVEDGRPVQYFERARLEWHGELGITLAGHLGRWAAQGRESEPAFAWSPNAPAGDSYFSETGHSLGGAFRSFWQGNGGLATFGYPISEPFAELSAQDGQSYMVQYFERARFESHPENEPRYQVQLGHLGRQYLAAHPAPAWATQPVASVDQAWAAVRPTHVRIPRIGVDTDIVSAGFSLGEWDVPRYTAAHYWPISGYPGTPGNIVLAGHVGYRGIIFSKLPNAAAGDEIYLAAGGGERRYIVREVLTLLPSDTWVMAPTSDEVLTLITCVPIGVYTHRLIVRAYPG